MEHEKRHTEEIYPLIEHFKTLKKRHQCFLSIRGWGRIRGVWIS